jgi:hypothetical protein
MVNILPVPFEPEHTTIHTLSTLCVGSCLRAWGYTSLTSFAWAAGSGPLLPFSLARDTTLRDYFWYAGNVAAAGDIDVGIYAEDAQTLLNSTGGVARGANGTIIRSNVGVDVRLPRGRYYLAFSVSASETIYGVTGQASLYEAAGILTTTDNYPLASSPTLAAPLTNCPYFGTRVHGVMP